MAVGERLVGRIRVRLRRLVARHPGWLARAGSVRALADRIGAVDPWITIVELRPSLGFADAVRIVLDPESLAPGVLSPLIASAGPLGRPYVHRTAILLAKRHPVDAKSDLVAALLAGRRGFTVALIPEVAKSLNLADAGVVIATLLPDALQPLDPYDPGATGLGRRAVVSVLAVYPPLVDTVLAAGSAPLSSAIAADLVVAATSRGGLLTSSVLPRIGPLLADDSSELIERLRVADNRYSTADPLDSRERPGRLQHVARFGRAVRARASVGFRVRLLALLAIDLATVIAMTWLLGQAEAQPFHLPTFASGEVLAVAGLIVALHVLAVQLAAESLAPGLLSAGAWPARLISAYSAVAAVVAATALDAPKPLIDACAFVLLAHLPAVARDLVAKSDLERASRRVLRDRMGDIVVTGAAASRVFRERLAVRALLSQGSSIRRATVEPATRRRIAIRAARDGYVTFDQSGLARLRDLFVQSASSPLGTGRPGPALALLHDPGGEISAGSVLAVLESDEPSEALRMVATVGQTVRARQIPAVDRSRAAVVSLAQIHNAQAATDRRGAELTSRRIEVALRRFLVLAEGGLQGLDAPSGYLDNVLPFNPEIDAVFVFEAGWRQAIELSDDRQSGVLKDHAVRLAGLVAVSPYSVALDALIARLELVARDASDDAAHSCALLLAELGGIAAENGRRASYRPARQAIEGMLERMAIRTPVPRVEQLVSQRLEELLARGMIADYFLETEVERGCQTLLKLAAAAPAGRRQARLAFGLAKIGGAALQWGRISLAANIAFQAAAKGIDLSQAKLLAEDEAYNARMTVLSSLAGEVFGGDVGASVVGYVDWALDLTRTFTGASSIATTAAASGPNP